MDAMRRYLFTIILFATQNMSYIFTYMNRTILNKTGYLLQ